MDKLKNHVNIEAEKGILYLLCNFPDRNDLIYQAIHPDMFYFKPYRNLYTVFMDLNEKQYAIDIETLQIEIDKNHFADRKNLMQTISDMTEAGTYSCNTNVLVSELIENYRKRMFLKLSVEMQDELTGKTTEEIKDKIDYEIDRIMKHYEVSDVTPSDSLRNILKDLDPKATIDNVRTGFSKLDSYLHRLKEGTLITLGAATSVGKTALALNIVWNLFNDFKKVLVFALEVNAEDNYRRIISNISDIPYDKFSTKMLNKKDFGIILHSMSRLKSDSLHIYDKGVYSVKKIRQYAEKYIAKNGSLDLLVVDHIQLLSDKKSNSILEAVSNITKELKILSKDLKCAILALSQLNRSSDSSNPKISDLRSSGTIEQDSDIVLLLTRDEGANNAMLYIKKNRDGKTGKVSLNFDGNFQRFTESKNQF